MEYLYFFSQWTLRLHQDAGLLLNLQTRDLGLRVCKCRNVGNKNYSNFDTCLHHDTLHVARNGTCRIVWEGYDSFP